MGAARWLAGCVLALIFGSQAAAQQIGFAEPANILARPGSSQFDAFGQRFTLRLESNDPVLARLPTARKASLSNYRLLRGTLAGKPGSWARLTTHAGRVSGAIWDGQEMYVVARYEDVAPSLVEPADFAPGQLVMFRLSDTVDALPANFCAMDGGAGPAGKGNALRQYRALLAELGQTAAAVLTDQMELAIIADTAMQNRLTAQGSDVTFGLLDRFNIAQGLFEEQLDLLLQPTEIHLVPASSDPFTATQASTLLSQLTTFRQDTQAMRNQPVAHLITAKNLDGDTAGIAKLGGACSVNNGVSITEDQAFSPFFSALIMAHEIAHNLDAEHDDATCGGNFIMNANLSGSSTFSQCSRDQIRPFIAQHRGTCFTAPVYADGAVAFDIPSVQRMPNTPFTIGAIASSVGTQVLNTVRVRVIANPSITLVGASANGGSCSVSGSTATCDFASIAAGASQRIDVTATVPWPTDAGFMAQLSASNDRIGNNNSANASARVDPPFDIRLTGPSPSLIDATTGDIVELRYSLASLGPQVARDARFSLGRLANFDFLGISSPGATCSFEPFALQCAFGDLAGGETRQIVVTGIPAQAGQESVIALSSSANEYNQGNNSAVIALRVAALRDVGITLPGQFNQYVAFDTPTDLTYEITAGGQQPIDNVRVRLTADMANVQSMSLGGVACALISPTIRECSVDSLSPGQTRSLQIRVLFPTGSLTSSFNVLVTGDGDGDARNGGGQFFVMPLPALDVSIHGTATSYGYEGMELQASAMLANNGLNPASSVTATFEVPAPLELLSATVADGTCSLITSRRIDCAVASMPRFQMSVMTVRLRGPEPGSYLGRFTATAPGDLRSDNNGIDNPISINPVTDISVGVVEGPGDLITNAARTYTVRVSTGARAVTGARFEWQIPPSLVMDSIAAPAGSCSLPDMQRVAICSLGDVAGNANIDISASIRAVGAWDSAFMQVRTYVNTSEFNSTNNFRGRVVQTHAPGDVSVSVASTAVSAEVGNFFNLPRITINTQTRVSGIRLTVPLPSFVNVDTMASTGGMCSGITTIQCDFPVRDAGHVDSVDIRLRANVSGTFTSNIEATAANDSSAGNNTASFAITSNAPPPPPPPPSSSSSSGGGKKGGGGAFEWLTLAALLGVRATPKRRR